MNGSSTTVILEACRRFLRPLAKLLLRYGIGYREFSTVCKECFVEVASEEFGRRGRPTNMSRISVATGLSRKEISRIRALQGSPEKTGNYGLTPASVVLRGWYSDPDFVSKEGVPLALDVDGTEKSLTNLVARYAGDVTVGAVLAEFSRLGIVEHAPGGRVRPLSAYFMPPNANGQSFAAGVQSLSNLLGTISYNTNPNHVGAGLFERYAWTDRLPEATRTVAHRLVTDKGQEFLSYFDKWFREHEVTTDECSAHKVEVGVGIYYFDTTKN